MCDTFFISRFVINLRMYKHEYVLLESRLLNIYQHTSV